MSKSSAPEVRVKTIFPAIWIVAVVLMAVAALAVAGHNGLRRVDGSSERESGSLTAKAVAAPLQPAALSVERRSQVRANLGALPLAFEANQGQTDPQVKYVARGNGYMLFLTAKDAVFAPRSGAATEPFDRYGLGRQGSRAAERDRTAAIYMQLVGGNPQARIAAGDELPGKSNYFIGNDRSRWQQGVKQYAAVSYEGVYPGVNLAFHGEQRQVEFDFVVSPGAKASPIALSFSGAREISTDSAGKLTLATAAGNVTLHPPVAYQEKNGARQSVDARFVLKADDLGNKQVGFALGDYDHSRELVIDPSVSYATYLGGSAEDDGNAIAIDGSGNAYVTGETKSANFPTKGGVAPNTNAGGFDVFVTKISPSGILQYSTYVGGTGDDSGNAIAVDASGNAFVAGGTPSNDFPTTGAAFQKTFGGVLDAFVFELASNGGSLVYSTYLGGSGSDYANGIAVDGSGDAYVVGSTGSTNFPPKNPKQASLVGSSNGFVTKLNSSGNTLVYSTYLGGGSNDLATAVAVDGSDQAYVTGATKNPKFPTFPTTGTPPFQKTCGTDGTCNGGLYDAFVTVYNAAGSGYVYSTFLGGEGADQGFGIAVDGSGDAYVTGLTASSQFPTQSAWQGKNAGGNDAFVTELKPDGSGLVYSTYLGGTGDDFGQGIAVDGTGKAYVTGQTVSTNFPTASPTQSANGGGNDAFVSEMSAGGSALLFSTYLGGSGNENTIGGGAIGAIAVDSSGANFYVTGNTTSNPFPTVAAEQSAYSGGIDAFVAAYTQSTSASFAVTDGALSATSGGPGVSATSTITVTSVNGFNSAVTLTCAVSPTVAKGPTCGFSNPGGSVTPAANGTATATLTVSTTAATAALKRPTSRSRGLFYAMLMPVGGMALFGAGLGSSGSRRRKLFGLALLGIIFAALLLMPACGGGNGGGGGGGGTPGTPAGAYTISVTGASGGVNANGTPSLTLTVN